MLAYLKSYKKWENKQKYFYLLQQIYLQNYEYLKSSILITNLNFKQRIILILPKTVIKTLSRIQHSLIKKNIYLTTFNP